MMELHQAQLIIISAIVLLVFLILFFIIRQLITYQRKKAAQETRDTSQVGFVVDTFHELVSQLKDKERELESLKSHAEERASEFEIYNENIFQSVPSGVMSLDRDLRITKMNASALKILALKEEDVIGMSSGDIFQEPIREMIARKGVVERAETAYTTGSGKRLWIGLTISPLRDSQDEVIGRLLIFTDLTELKAFQSQKELRDRLSTLGEMSAGIAHELRNPMGVISGYTKILSKKVDATLLPTVTAIAKEVEVMDRIIADFLTFARPAEPLFGPVDLAALVSECVEMIRGGSRNVRVNADPSCLPVIQADEVMMRQALSNLLRNAAEAMPEGGEITISCVLNHQNIVLTISDSGHGIPENIRDKIFLPFYTTKERGTGLGLAIVHKIIVSHGGTIRTESSDKGTAFVISLPKEMVVKA
jgi:PAS domain S-box-containing protein